jgi:UDP:flavonoid glycosyltransferase YjiC (YdhE family)
MQITIFALGSRGDVQPYIALGKGLNDAGHAVRVLTSQDFHELVTTYGLDFFDVGGNMQAIAQGMEGLLEQGNFLKILSSMGEAAQRLASQAAVSGLAACQGADLIIGGLGGLFSGLAVSEKLGIPCIPAYYYPLTPTGEYRNAMAPLPDRKLPAWVNRLSHRAVQQMIWQNFRAADNKARREVLQMAPAPFWGPYNALQAPEQTVLYGYSPHVIPSPQDWGPNIHVTGYWFLEPPAGWEPPADLVDFLHAGPPPVYVGFGSMINSRPEETAEMVVQALARAGQRGVLSAGWGGLKAADLPKSVFMIGSVPFDWLFPRTAAVVHHGGAGTTSMGLRAGIPSIITPFMGDQPFWGKRVYELGVGPKPIPRKQLSVDRLAESIRIAVSDGAMQARAARLGEHIRAENGVARAVAVIEQSRAE